MDKKHAEWMNPTASEYIGTGLAGFGLGLGARGIRHLLDLRKKRDLPPEVPAIPSNKSPVPVEVSPEEAQQLEQSGVTVKHAETFLDNAAKGALLVPTAYAGWKLLDNHLANQRKAIAQKRLDAARGRLQGLMSDDPMAADQPLHTTMKAAEAHYFAKQAEGPVGEGLSGIVNSASWLGWPLGVSSALLGLSAYNRTTNENKAHKTLGQLRGYQENQEARPSEAEIVPIVRDHKKDEHAQHPVGHPQMATYDQLKVAEKMNQPEHNGPTKLPKVSNPATNGPKNGKLQKILDAKPDLKDKLDGRPS